MIIGLLTITSVVDVEDLVKVVTRVFTKPLRTGSEGGSEWGAGGGVVGVGGQVVGGEVVGGR